MAHIRLDSDGTASAVQRLTAHGGAASDNAAGAERALAAAAASGFTPALVDALDALATRLSRRAADVGAHVTELASGVRSAGEVLERADDNAASAARGMRAH